MSRLKQLSRKKVLKAKFFEVILEQLESEKGTKYEYHTAYRSPVVAIFPVTDYQEIYLISQYRRVHKQTLLECMGGFVEEKESLLSAAKRELEEEAGIIASHWEKIGRLELGSSVFKGTVHLFLAKDLEHVTQKLEESEEISVVKMSIKEAAEKVMIGEIFEAAAAFGILTLDKLAREKKL